LWLGVLDAHDLAIEIQTEAATGVEIDDVGSFGNGAPLTVVAEA
jgi:hypothetical protein